MKRSKLVLPKADLELEKYKKKYRPTLLMRPKKSPCFEPSKSLAIHWEMEILALLKCFLIADTLNFVSYVFSNTATTGNKRNLISSANVHCMENGLCSFCALSLLVSPVLK